MLSVVAASERAATLEKTWSWIGPFASGKTEYEGDPLVPHGGVHRLFVSRKSSPVSLYSEYHTGGVLTWEKMRAEPSGTLTIPHNNVNWNAMHQNPPAGSPLDVLHAQYWVVGTLKTTRSGSFAIDCGGLHTFELARFAANGTLEEQIGPLMGNIYSKGRGIGAVPVALDGPATYRLFSRVRGKPALRFRCELREPSPKKPPVAVAFGTGEQDRAGLPDVVHGKLLSPASAVAIDVRNPSPSSWLRIRARVRPAAAASASSTTILVVADAAMPESVSSIAPAAATRIVLRIRAEGRPEERDAPRCATFAVELFNASDVADAPPLAVVSFGLRCRLSTQSALMTFFDADGSLATKVRMLTSGVPNDVYKVCAAM